MKLRLYSDLHTEFAPFDMPVLPDEKETVLLLAGDICVARKNNTLPFVTEWANRHAAVIYVPGNHEYYGGQMPAAWQNMEEYFEDVDNLFMLNPGTVEINNCVFIGATLWSELQGVDADKAGMYMNDYRSIGKREKLVTEYRGKLKPADTTALHYAHRKFIFDEVEKAGNRATVVVTHHGPSEKSIAQQYHGDGLNAAYVTDLEEDIIRTQPNLWVHGHVHSSFNYEVGCTSIITNPRGYPVTLAGGENPHFMEDGDIDREVGPCPFASEIGDDYDPCVCSADTISNCCADI